MVSSASGRTDEPVRMNCDGSPRLSTSLRILSQIGGKACHSSISRGVFPANNVAGLISIICVLCIKTEESPKSRILRAICFAVVVLPHHFGPSISTAPLPRIFRFNILSAIRCLYFAINIFVLAQKYMFFLSQPKIFGDLWLFCSVICGRFIR